MNLMEWLNLAASSVMLHGLFQSRVDSPLLQYTTNKSLDSESENYEDEEFYVVRPITSTLAEVFTTIVPTAPELDVNGTDSNIEEDSFYLTGQLTQREFVHIFIYNYRSSTSQNFAGK